MKTKNGWEVRQINFPLGHDRGKYLKLSIEGNHNELLSISTIKYINTYHTCEKYFEVNFL